MYDARCPIVNEEICIGGRRPSLRNRDIHWRRARASGLDCSCHLAEADLRHLVVMVDVADPGHAAVLAGEEHLVGVGDPDRRLVRNREIGGGHDGADRRVGPEDVEELGVEDLEEGRGRVGGVEELGDGRLAEGPVNAEHVEREGVDELCAMDGEWMMAENKSAPASAWGEGRS